MNYFDKRASLAQFKASFILDFAENEIVKRGKGYYNAWSRCRLQNLSSETARYTVRGTHDYKVEIYVEDGEFVADCDCPYSDNITEIICKHKVAAALHLENHLRYNPVPDWRNTLETVLNNKAKKAAANNFLVFSLQAENSRWSVIPYQLPARYFPVEIRENSEQVKEIILDKNLTQFAKKLKSQDYWNDQNFVNLELTQKSLLKLFSGGYGFGAYGFNFEAFVGLVGDLPFFRGSSVNPFKNPLKIYTDAGRIEFDLQRTESELVLRSLVVLDEAEERIQLKTAEILNQNPLWLLAGQKVFHLPESSYVFERLKASANLKVPLAEEVFFWEKFLPNLAENYQVSGEAINWQELAYERVVPRLFLQEKDEILQIELRFGYGHLEIAAEKNPAPEAIRRDAESGILYRFKRDLIAENDIREMLAEARFGTKKTADANIFLLRAKVHPFDFLTKYIPLLTAEGFEVFGEEELKSVRINRHRPTISFGITSGIDWFDLDAVVQFGDLAVSLKDFRKAVRKKERFIKLADGSIGEIPPEWIEKYKHLFGLGAESDEKLRFGKYHLTLLDQLFDGEQAVKADREFKEKLEKLKSFEQIKERKLPKNFVGELRPYQKHGFDWLYFLHEYGFGGCLADDMGTGKCVSADSFIFVNGEIKKAENLWIENALKSEFDGEGYWTTPRNTLTTNSIDEATGKIVLTRIKRLYRQKVKEKLRRVILEDGQEITLTGRHRLLTPQGWRRDLKTEDYVCLPARLVWQGKNSDADLVEFLAWQIAEGYEQNSRATLTITQKDTNILERLKVIFQRLSEKYAFPTNKPRIVQSRNKCPYLVIDNIGYRRFLESKNYVWGKLSGEKMIPPFIMQSGDETIKHFLRHFFDAEAAVPKSGRSIEISSASVVLINQLTTLLRRLGIWLRISQKEKCATNGSKIKRVYQIGSIGGKSLRRFQKQIGFGCAKKQMTLNLICQKTCNTNVEGIPASAAVADFVRTTGLPHKHLGVHCNVYLNGTQEFSKQSLTRVADAVQKILSGEMEKNYRALPKSKWTIQTLESYAKLNVRQILKFENLLDNLLDKEVFYCKIKSIEEVEYDGWVYDFEVENQHNFVSNNILCHNTVQVLAFLQSLKERGELRRGGNLLIVPRSLVFNWQREAEKFTPRLKILDYSTPDRAEDLAEFDDYDLVISTYALVLRDIEKLVQREFNYVILDESQAVKNPLAETGKAARLLRAKHRLTMTGTPIENNTLELWSQFAFLNPGFLGSADYFRENFTNPIERKADENSVKVLRRMIHPFVLRRTKEQVASDLPPRSTRQIFCEADERQRKFYLDKRDYYRSLLLKMFEEEGLDKSRFQVLEGLLRLRQICNHPVLVEKSYKGKSAKLEMLIETLETLRAEGHKALIFSQFVQMLKLVEKELKARKISYTYLDGKTKNRREKIDEFQNNSDIPFFLISLKAGGVGLNLTAADYVLHVDPWWNPAVEQQATDRTHRIGQDKPVFVYKFVMRDSVEEKILLLQERKRNLSSQLISTEASFFKSLTADDIKGLFS